MNQFLQNKSQKQQFEPGYTESEAVRQQWEPEGGLVRGGHEQDAIMTATRDSIEPPNGAKLEGLQISDTNEGGSAPGPIPIRSATDAPYCILPELEKVLIMLLVSFASIISPVSSSIYFPILNRLATQENVSLSLINLTITTYLIFQGIAPSFVGNFSDVYGRRPAYLVCFVIYLGANIGLALQNNYVALMVLRCMQSSGSSGTIALGSAVVADISTRAERGKYIGYATMGVTLGPALGPVIGGLLDYYYGWRAIFWFLAIFSGVFGIIITIALPETCRAVVGNGSVPAAKWNRSLWELTVRRFWKKTERTEPDNETIQQGGRRPNPFASLKIVTEREGGLVLMYGSLLYAGYMMVLSTLSTELENRFGFNTIQVGLCYLPLGMGSLTSRWTVGYLLDRNFKREAKRQGLPIVKNRQQDIANFNVEVARLLVSLPMIYASCLCIIIYGWVMEYKTALAGPMVMLFFTGHLTTGAFNSLNTLVVDIHYQSPATAVAANNLFRCSVGAGAVAIATPLIRHIGIGWTASFIAFLWILFTPFLWVVVRWGHGWRKKAQAKLQEKEAQSNRSRDLEGGPPDNKKGRNTGQGK
ncbi:hypothetical protein ARAM_002296 [Aspergillus rambellii]|uniref:Major facilitator superfamily (MFS) profile domain-containing protein n=1 Tax=Aspergillus rambellii TaxID=308745 RepID=A0A0F8VVV9_9EURO|nr:hypothetical protein ARAM_002296 [Aspergillus rambellii]